MELEQESQNGRRSSRLQHKTKQRFGLWIDYGKSFAASAGEEEDSSSDFQLRIQSQHQLDRRPKRAQDRSYYQEEEDEEVLAEESGELQQKPHVSRVFQPDISQVLWRREREGQVEYLVKFKDRSYLQVEWLGEQQILEQYAGSKQKLSRFNKVFQKRLLEDDIDPQNETQFFDPSYTEPDRILATTEIFPVVHPKKGSELKGRWSEWLQVCVSKLLNFTKHKVKYGVFFMEPVNPEKDGCPNYRKVVQHPMDLGTINNRVYLGYYKDYGTFWSEVGLVFKNCRKYNRDNCSDIRVLCDTLREVKMTIISNQCAIYLYKQWYETMRQKYDAMLEQQKYVNDEARQREIDEAKRKDFIDELRQERLRSIAGKYTLFEEEEDAAIDADRLRRLIEEDLGVNVQVECETATSIVDAIAKALEGYDIPYDANTLEQMLQEFQQQQKMVDRDLDLWNPGEMTLDWIQDESGENLDECKYLSEMDKEKKLALHIEVDRLYLVKWKNLSYLEATWEKESNIASPAKLMEFRQFNRSLDKDTRGLMMQQYQRHKVLLDQEMGIKKKKISQQQLNEIRNQLYFYKQNHKEPQLYVPSTQPVYKDRKLLRDYQLQSLNWLIQAWYQDRNVILADEMGLGKTVQTIAFLNHLHSLEGCRGPFLVIAPLSTLTHWKRTAEEWTNMNAVLYYDSDGGDGRAVCRYYEWFYTDISTKGSILNQNEIIKFQILIVSYEVFQQDVMNVLLNVPFQFIVVDEAHRLKNQNARILQSLKKLPCKRTLLLTGTPVQNNTDELFSLLNFIEPRQFPSAAQFKQEFGDLNSAEQIEHLNVLLKPYILRRQKEDVEQQIPPLQETIIDIEMTTIQKTLYKAIYERNKSMLLQGFSQSAASATQLNNMEIQLRKCCNHPFLIKEMQHELTKDCRTPQEYAQVMVESSGKMMLLEKLLTKFKEEGKKVLIFSQFTYMLALIEDFLKTKGTRYEKIDGQIKARERQNAIDRFNDLAKQRDVFLLSTKAGGQGINLTAAEVVIIYDSDWNPQNDVQATARAHRIGQSKEVAVYRLVTKNTYEAEMFERATRKLGLDQAIFMGGAFKKPDEMPPEQKKLTKQEVEILLKKGILGLVQEREDGGVLQTQDINEILERDSRMAKYSLINGSYTISKHSFVSEKTDQSLRIEDPNFWQIILKNTESKTQKLLKHFNERQQHLSVFEQKKFMLDIADCVHALIDSKLSHQGYNADDEKNLIELLNQINVSKHFTKKLKDMATNWLYEVNKPSRRFKKITPADMEMETVGTTSSITAKQPVQSGFQPPKSRKSNGNFSDGEDAKRLAQKSKEELVKKLCYVCERSSCSHFCMGFCRRAFHENCKTFLENNREWTNAEGAPTEFLRENSFNELQLGEEELKAQINIKYVCPDCSQNQVICNICKKRGVFYPNESQSKCKLPDDINSEPNQDQVAFDDSPVTKPKPKQRNGKLSELSKCSTANCNRYFHLECIQAHPNAKLLDSSDTLFRCPAHVCAYCRINSSNTTTALIHCVRCCRSFHLKCASPDAKRKMQKVGKKLMLCDQCNKSNTIIKIQLEPPIHQQQPHRNLKQSKLNFKDTVLRIRRSDLENENHVVVDQQEPAQQPQQLQYSGTLRQQAIEKNLRKRRMRQFDPNPEDSPEQRKKQLQPVIRKKGDLPQLTYEDLGIIPVSQFDYSKYQKDWCRYCGARFASNFTKGPWGSRTLCTIHYINWGQKRSLDLSAYAETPTQPINREDPTELQFLQRQKQRDESYDPRKELEAYNTDEFKLL